MTPNAIRYAPLVGLLTLATGAAGAQDTTPIPLADARRVFSTAETLCRADHGKLWGVSLCGPIMLVDPQSRAIVASHADAEGILEPRSGLHVGHLPTEENIANTAIDWAGVRWTQLMWPLTEDIAERRTVLLHELFHRVQPSLDLPAPDGGDNAHLDSAECRYLLQLEWRALAAALGATDAAARKQTIADALLFRAERHRRFPDAAKEEQALMIREGLAEYTGVRLGNRQPADQVAMALDRLRSVRGNASFVRSFVYASGPAYGLLLDRDAPSWRDSIHQGASLASLLSDALSLAPPTPTQRHAESRARAYDGEALWRAETERKARRDAQLAAYRIEFVDEPVLRIALKGMKIQFKPSSLVPLEPVGTVYPTLRIVDDWGVLEVADGALLAKDWSSVTVPVPADREGPAIEGDGWTLQLNDGWRLVPGSRPGDLELEKQGRETSPPAADAPSP